MRYRHNSKKQYGESSKIQMFLMLFVNESGVYSLVFGSKLESAQRFKHRVTSEVLPAIRKNGYYSMLNMKEKLIAEQTSRIHELDKTVGDQGRCWLMVRSAVIALKRGELEKFKLDGSAEVALKQIDNIGYANEFLASGKVIHKIGVNISSETGTVAGWKIGEM